jgi:hypothetical protein
MGCMGEVFIEGSRNGLHGIHKPNIIIIIIIIIFISINPVQSRIWKSQYKYKISSKEYEVNIVIEASKYIKQGDIISAST